MALSLAIVQTAVTAANIAGKQVTAVRPGTRRTLNGDGLTFTTAAGSLSYTGTARIVGTNLVLYSAYFAPIGSTYYFPVAPDELPQRVDAPPSPSGTPIVADPVLFDGNGLLLEVRQHATDATGHLSNTTTSYNWPADPVDPTSGGAAAALATALTDWQPGGALTVSPYSNPVTALTLDIASLISISQSTLNAHPLKVSEVGTGIYS